MYRIKSKTLIQSIIIIGLITSFNLHADTGLDKALNKHQKTFEAVALKIWDWAEVGYQEFKSSALLKEELLANGFDIQSGVADIPTAY